MTGGLPTPAQTRPLKSEAPRRNKRRRRQRPSLARRHGQQLNAWDDTTQQLRKNARARIIAEVHTLFANRWAELLKLKGRPDFAARVAALQAEQNATQEEMLKRTLGLLRSERAATRALLLDNQRRQRKAAAAAELAQSSPEMIVRALAGRFRQQRLARQFLFMLAGRFTTIRGLTRFMARPAGLHPWHSNLHPDNKKT